MSKSRSRKSAPSSPASSPSTVNWTASVWRSTLARLTPAELRAFRLAARAETLELPPEAIAALNGLWAITARDAQLQPEGDWRVWYLRGGRGSGKTRTGAETLADWILAHDPGEWAVIAPTFGDARDVCVEGPSGLLSSLGPAVENWNRSIGELYVENGAKVYIDGADDGALRIQGKNLRGAWCDEVGLWRNWETAWDESLAFAVRLEPGKVVATGTPKTGHPLVRALLADADVAKTHMRMLDNAANLHPAAVEYLLAKYKGTRRGRQELDGEFLEEVLGALWQAVVIDRNRVKAAPKLDRIVVGVDPSGAADEDTGANEIGIVAAGFSTQEQHGYVVADRSLRAGPHEWASAVVRCYHDLEADLIVAERNFGGEMVRHTIQSVDRNVPVKLVTSSRGKAIRAEPVAALYEQDRVHHVGTWPELEEQMCHWVPPRPGERTVDSPDRMDALVFALTELMVSPGGGSQYPSYDEGREPVVRRGDLVLRGERYVDKK